ncbi:MAG TPA: DUF969 family protein [Kofleriaceae bacterium]
MSGWSGYAPLCGVAVVVAGFAWKRNPVVVVVIAAVVSALIAGRSPGELLALLGVEFVKSRTLLLIVLSFPVIGVLERAGLSEHARRWVAGFGRLTLARLLIGYLAMRQVLAMFGLTSVAGHAQTVRPLLAPMSEATADRALGPLDDAARARIRALAAATDNVGVFFGEDVFLAFGAVLLIQKFYDGQGLHLEPGQIARWALPTAIAAFVIHGARILAFQRRLARELRARPRAGLGDRR